MSHPPDWPFQARLPQASTRPTLLHRPIRHCNYGHAPARLLGAYLQRATGYSLTGLATEEILFFICGPTAGGKSTFISAVGGALGDYAASANFATFLAQRNKSGPRPDIVRLDAGPRTSS